MTTGRHVSKLAYQIVEDWLKLPDGWALVECPGVAVDARDNVYILSRGKHPVIVCDRDGNFLRSFGEGLFSNWPHSLHIDPDGSIYTVDNGNAFRF